MSLENHSYADAAQVEAAAPESQNFFARLMGVYFSPGETFQSIGRKPTFLTALILLIVFSGALVYLMMNRIGYENIVRKQIQSMVTRGWVPEDKAEEIIQQSLKGESRGIIQGVAQATVGTLIMLLVVAGLLKLVTLLMGADNTFKQVFAVTTWSYCAIGLITIIVGGIIMYLKPPDEIDMYNLIGSNVGSVVTMTLGNEALPKFLTSLLTYVDLFYIWRASLLAIGLAAVSRNFKTGASAMWVGALFFFFALIGAVFGSVFGG